jgi:hypothetical protein
MEELFASRDKLIRVEHIGCLSKVMNWKVGNMEKSNGTSKSLKLLNLLTPINFSATSIGEES